jgi:hypothetical protein
MYVYMFLEYYLIVEMKDVLLHLPFISYLTYVAILDWQFAYFTSVGNIQLVVEIVYKNLKFSLWQCSNIINNWEHY